MLPSTVDGWLETTGALQDRIARLQADLRAALDIAEASAKECERLRGACERALAIAESRGTWGDLMRVLRAALAPEEPR